MYRVFLSYSHDDRDRADRVRKRLETEGIDVLVDHEHVTAGDELTPRLKELISRCHAVVVFLTQHSQDSNYVKLEFKHASSLKIPIVPVVLGSVSDWPWWAMSIGHTVMVNGINLTENLLDQTALHVRRRVTRARVVSFFNMKGGVGKTTLAAQFAARVAIGTDTRKPRSVLLPFPGSSCLPGVI